VAGFVLGVALKLGKYIKENFNDIEVIYTRKTDKFVRSYERTSLANDNEADLFISIHTNSGPRTAYGTESYVLGFPKNNADDAVLLPKRCQNSGVLGFQLGTILLEQGLPIKILGNV